MLLMGLAALLVPNVNAYPPTLGGWGAWPKCVLVWSDWLGVANYEVKPSDVNVTIELLKVQIHYLNPGGQGGGLGQPFYPVAEDIGGTDPLSDPVDKKGKYHSEITFTGDVLLDAIDPSSVPPPPNPQWTIDPVDPVVVLEMYVTIRGFADFDGDGTPEKETAHVAGPCTLNYDRTQYTCTTGDSWGYKKSDPTCPYEQ